MAIQPAELLYDMRDFSEENLKKIKSKNPHVKLTWDAFTEGKTIPDPWDRYYGRHNQHNYFSFFFQLITSSFLPEGIEGIYFDMYTAYRNRLKCTDRTKDGIKAYVRRILSDLGNNALDTNFIFWKQHGYTGNKLIRAYPVWITNECFNALKDEIVKEYPDNFIVIENTENNRDEPFRIFYYDPNENKRTFLAFFREPQENTPYYLCHNNMAFWEFPMAKMCHVLSGFLIREGIKNKDPKYADMEKFLTEYKYELEILEKYGNLSLRLQDNLQTPSIYSEVTRTSLASLINKIPGFSLDFTDYIDLWRKKVNSNGQEDILQRKVIAADQNLKTALEAVLRYQQEYNNAQKALTAFLLLPPEESPGEKAIKATLNILTNCKNVLRLTPNRDGVTVEFWTPLHFGNDKEYIKSFYIDPNKRETTGNMYKRLSYEGKEIADAMREFMTTKDSRFTFLGYSCFSIVFGSTNLPASHSYPDNTYHGVYPGNPHFTHYTCYGSFGNTITQSLRNMDYDTALNLLLEAASGLNTFEPFTIEAYINYCASCTNKNFVRDLKTGEDITIEEAYKRLEEDKILADAQAIEEATTEQTREKLNA